MPAEGGIHSKEPSPVHPIPVHLNEVSEMLTPGLGKMYVIQAGLVIIPIFFIWLVTKRARVEEVQVAIHNRDHAHHSNPKSKNLSLIDAVSIVRATNNLRQTVNNDFNKLT